MTIYKIAVSIYIYMYIFLWTHNTHNYCSEDHFGSIHPYSCVHDNLTASLFMWSRSAYSASILSPPLGSASGDNQFEAKLGVPHCNLYSTGAVT